MKPSLDKAKGTFQKRHAALKSIENNFEATPAEVKKLLNVASADEAAAMAEEFDLVLRNWNEFVKYTKLDLATHSV